MTPFKTFSRMLIVISLCSFCLLGLTHCTSATHNTVHKDTPAAVSSSTDDLKEIKDLRILVVVYRGYTNAAPDKQIDDWELQSIKNAAECARTYYFRNTRGELVLTYTYELINTPTPSMDGPTYDNIVADLRSRGYVNNQYDGVISTGIGFNGNWGGFTIFDRTGACLGIPGTGGQLRQFPNADTNTGYDTAWIFVHEFQHALDLSIAGSSAGFIEFLHGHPYTDHNDHDTNMVEWVENPGGQHWDWEACTLRNFKHYLEIPGATSSRVLAKDSDGDGLADFHPYLPMDEKRFGTDPFNPDTDGDGLSDLKEFTADVYKGSDPLIQDTDEDGKIDSVDPWPTVAIADTIPYAYPAPVIDGIRDDIYGPLNTRWYACRYEDKTPRNAFRTYTCWDEDNLYIYAIAPTSFTYKMQVDTSAENGFWIGGDTYIVEVPYNEQPKLEWPRDTTWSCAHAEWKVVDGETCMEVILPAAIGTQGVTSGQKFPEDTATGLEILENKDISFNIEAIVKPINEHILLNPTWTMISTTPVKSEDVPPNPVLWYSTKLQQTTTPEIEIRGVFPDTDVTIIDENGNEYGAFTGNGTYTLSEMKPGTSPENGAYTLYAVTDCGTTSSPFTIVLDVGAAPPEMTLTRKKADAATITVAGEPHARVIIESVMENEKTIPLYSLLLDENGKGEITIDPGRKGFAATYYDTDEWTEPLFYRVDPVIDFKYEDGSPIKDVIKPDTFSMIWKGDLTVKEATQATFILATDDGSRLFIDDKMVIDHWGVHEPEEKTATVDLTAGTHEIKVQYYENLGWAAAHLYWQPKGSKRTEKIPVIAPGSSTLRARQIDPLGNESELSVPKVIPEK